MHKLSSRDVLKRSPVDFPREHVRDTDGIFLRSMSETQISIRRVHHRKQHRKMKMSMIEPTS